MSGSPVRFRTLLDGAVRPNKLDVARDRLVLSPTRFIRELARAATNRAVLRFLGREDLSKVKVLWASRFGLKS